VRKLWTHLHVRRWLRRGSAAPNLKEHLAMSLEPSGARRLRLKIEPRNVPGVSDLTELNGASLSAMVPQDLVTERLLSTLSQLARFGLAPTSPPLLKPARKDFSFRTIIG
jgi:hypothetical protein